MNYKKMTAILLTMVILVGTGLAYADSGGVDGNDQASSDKELLSDSGFTKAEIKTLEDDIRQVANIIREQKLGDEEIQNLKNGFISSRPEAPEKSKAKKYEIKNGLVEYEDGIKVAVANRYNANEDISEASYAVTLAETSTGSHAITYTKSSYKFYEQTGYAQLPTVAVTSSNSRPYMMLGGYQQVSPYKGFDAGVVYYKEKNAWKVFINNGSWYENSDSSQTMITPNEYSSNQIYLDMKMANGYVTIVARNPQNWAIIDQVSVYMSSAFNTTPSSIELTREVALAQNTRVNDGSRMEGAHWSQVYLYSSSQTVKSLATYLQTSHPSRYQYSSTYPCYLCGDTLSDKSYITITNSSKYYEEYVKIAY